MDDPAGLYRWDPDLPDGLYDHPVFGELVPGRIVEVRADQKHLVASDDDWKKASRKDFDAQPPLDEEIARLRQPADPERSR